MKLGPAKCISNAKLTFRHEKNRSIKEDLKHYNWVEHVIRHIIIALGTLVLLCQVVITNIWCILESFSPLKLVLLGQIK